MTFDWIFHDNDVKSAFRNMQEDADAFQAFSEGSKPVLKFYAW
jgi:hypothetical protein